MNYTIVKKGRRGFFVPQPPFSLNKTLERELQYTKQNAQFYPNPRWAIVKMYSSKTCSFPWGLLDKVLEICSRTEYSFKVLTSKNIVPKIEFSENIRPYQKDAVLALIKNNGGILSMPTGSGKTFTAIEFLKMYKLPTLVICPTKYIVEQWKTQAPDYVDVRTYQGIKNLNDLNKYKICVFDECISGYSKIRLGNNSEIKMKDVFANDKVTHVLSYNESKKIFESKKILRKIKQPLKESWYKIKIKDTVGNHHELLATANHRIWTSDGYKRVDELIDNDILKVYLEPKSYFCKVCNKEFKNKQKMARCMCLHKHPNMCSDGLCDNIIKKFCYNHNAKIISIKKIKNDGRRFKYNLEIEDNHNYIANNILISNCHHVAAKTLFKIAMALKEHIVVGLSATP